VSQSRFWHITAKPPGVVVRDAHPDRAVSFLAAAIETDLRADISTTVLPLPGLTERAKLSASGRLDAHRKKPMNSLRMMRWPAASTAQPVDPQSVGHRPSGEAGCDASGKPEIRPRTARSTPGLHGQRVVRVETDGTATAGRSLGIPPTDAAGAGAAAGDKVERDD
jgi:hypothetical protein